MTNTDEALVAEARDWLEKMKDRGYHPLLRESRANSIIDRLASRLSQPPSGGWDEWAKIAYADEILADERWVTMLRSAFAAGQRSARAPSGGWDDAAVERAARSILKLRARPRARPEREDAP